MRVFTITKIKYNLPIRYLKETLKTIITVKATTVRNNFSRFK
jgi:hypothetical protein